jgi:hypothetical protein
MYVHNNVRACCTHHQSREDGIYSKGVPKFPNNAVLRDEHPSLPTRPCDMHMRLSIACSTTAAKRALGL